MIATSFAGMAMEGLCRVEPVVAMDIKASLSPARRMVSGKPQGQTAWCRQSKSCLAASKNQAG